MNRWFTRYLYGIENGVEKDPKSWIVREADAREQPTSYADYPHPEAKPVTLHPSGEGAQLGQLLTAAVPNQGTQTLLDNFSFSGASLAKAEWTNHRLLFATPKLTEPCAFVGHGQHKDSSFQQQTGRQSVGLAGFFTMDRQRANY
jgi:X-Pro dipeptidyl-peptidase